MTHGSSNGQLSAFDTDLNANELWAPFVGHQEHSLNGKPKLFFIQACRGEMTDPGIIYRSCPEPATSFDSVDCNEKIHVLPSLADLLVMYSTAKDHYSFRNLMGSWFVQEFCKEIKESATEDLLTILTGVNRRVAFARQSLIPTDPNKDFLKQMPNVVTMLTKKFFFKPRSNAQSNE